MCLTIFSNDVFYRTYIYYFSQIITDQIVFFQKLKVEMCRGGEVNKTIDDNFFFISYFFTEKNSGKKREKY